MRVEKHSPRNSKRSGKMSERCVHLGQNWSSGLGLFMIASWYESGWEIREIQSAGSAARGKRQAFYLSQAGQKRAIEEHDVWGIWQG